jgi:DNA-binding LacI/PurR family transcriptional regulator
MTKQSQTSAEHAVSIKDVAARAGVSISTVSNVLNGTKSVSDELCRRVLDAVEELHYHANTLASGLKSGKTNTLCVIVPSIVSVFFPKVLRGMQTAAAKNGLSLTIFETGDDFRKERETINLLRRQWVDGVLLSTCCDPEESAAYMEELRNLRIGDKRVPVVFYEEAPGEGVDSVVVDNKKASLKATKHLLEIGCRRIAYIAGPMHRFMMGKKRYEGYLAALREAGLEPDETLLREGDYTPISGYEQMRGLLLDGGGMDAVMCGNDQMAIGAIRALREAGLRMPEDVAVMGFDNNFPGTLTSPSLSTMSVPKQRMGQEAVELLLWRIRRGASAPARMIELEANLIVRQSTDTKGESAWDLYDW